jgi:hypothetical protein
VGHPHGSRLVARVASRCEIDGGSRCVRGGIQIPVVSGTGKDQVRGPHRRPAIERGMEGIPRGIDAVHVWTIKPVGPTTSRVHTEESWSGLLPKALRKMLQHTLKKSIDKGLPAIKAEAERRAHQ